MLQRDAEGARLVVLRIRAVVENDLIPRLPIGRVQFCVFAECDFVLLVLVNLNERLCRSSCENCPAIPREK